MRRVWSYATAQHMPVPYTAEDGVLRCRDCAIRLTRYLSRGHRSLRHHPRGKV